MRRGPDDEATHGAGGGKRKGRLQAWAACLFVVDARNGAMGNKGLAIYRAIRLVTDSE